MARAAACDIIAIENDLQIAAFVLNANCSQSRNLTGPALYVCNCNGIRERQARSAIEAGAGKPADIFRHCQARPRCAKCVCDMRRMIQDSQEALRLAAE